MEETRASLQSLPAFNDLRQRLFAIGLTEQSAYLFIRGHDLLYIVLKLLKAVAQPIIEQEFARRPPEERAIYQQYRKQHAFEVLLRSHRYYQDCHFYVRLLADARNALL